ncbi:MAG: right-handed parallel beta-helix repeat-containing protein [Phycisphaerales bacterium]|nr:right-handed parallel beta-helix repeat-containing protein [Phycisphaerales bacterium]
MRAICAIVASLVLAGTAFAETINVPGDYPTIQSAVDAANPGDEIVVAPGTYTSTQDGPVVDMKGKAITLRASGTAEETIIDGENTRGGIGCFNNETEATVIEGFTITNGAYGDGGGIFISAASPSITNCIVTNNSGTLGGGIYCGGQSNPIISGCTISGNTAKDSAGGIYCTVSNPTIVDCTISGNTAVNGGGGIYCCNSSSPIITGCTILNNNSSLGGGIHCATSSNPTITNCTISDNTANDEGGGIYNSSSSNSILSDTIVCGNDPDQIAGSWTNQGGNTIADVCPFISGACCTNNDMVCVSDTSEDDCLIYGGQWLGEGSSCDDCTPPVEPEVLGACCINGACIPSTAEGCFAGGGSYAGDGVACADAGCPEVCPGDLTGDNEVTIIDLLFVLDKWGATCP